MDLQEESEELSGAPQSWASGPAGRKQEADEVLKKMNHKPVPFPLYYDKDESPTTKFAPETGQETPGPGRQLWPGEARVSSPHHLCPPRG